MEQYPQLIKGNQHTDHRGTVSFVNNFDMEVVRRFYRINHPDTSIIRGWRGHRIEQRWFYVNKGVFKIKIIKIDDWEKPDPGLTQVVYILNADDNCVLHVPKGYATSMQALQPGSDLTIFADYYIENASEDDYLFPIDYFG